MAIRDLFKVSRKTFFNPSAWIDYRALRTHTSTIATVLSAEFTVPKPLREETFAQAMARLKLNESDVKSIARNYRLYALFFLMLGFLAFIYTFYILFRYWTLMGWILGMGVTALLLSQAFKYDFWSLQMRKRKLGLTFADWQNSVLGAKR